MPYDRVGAEGEAVPGCGGKLGMDVFRSEIERRFGFTFLGSCAIRTTTGGTNWSMHAVKRAIDFGYPQHDRARATKYLDYLTENNGARAHLLGIQALHDYAIGDDGSYGANRPLKRMWGHGSATWRFGRIGAGWFWTHTELRVAVASSAVEMRRRFELLDKYDASLLDPPSPPPPVITKDLEVIPFNAPARRVLDTRRLTRRPTSGSIVVVPRHPGLPANAKAVVATITMVDVDGPGFITAWTGGARPEESTQNTYQRGQTIAGQDVVQLDAKGEFRLYTSVGCHLLVDIKAYLS